MKTGQAGKALIKQFEGLPKPIIKKAKDGTVTTLYPPYICPAGYPTLGYGSRYKADGKEVTMKDKAIPLSECDALLDNTLGTYEDAVNRLVKVPLTQNMFDALVCFVYNLGEANLRISTLLKYLNKGDYQAAADQLLVWNKARVRGTMVAMPGLTRRRVAERELFLTPAIK